ncbi:glycosyl hydrolase family 39 [Actinocrispum wychmicini]|uniref:Glycosyl hydrolase family 39 n=1 Tax=Actinocrispum wychmicini TaxID=1213861 RepID=A0A4V2S6F8_9PSEU|nr:glycosyl hydrolase family 39 [Actinocrispum wychmicini]
MSHPPVGGDFARFLHELKDRSGRSYQALAAHTGISASALHRYCRGDGVPRQFAVVEKVGMVCGASKAELVELHRLWVLADAHRDLPADRAEPIPVAAPVVTPRTGLKTAVRVALTALLVLTMAAATARRTQPPAAQDITGPSWTRPPTEVRSELFGVTMNSSTGTMPGFRVGSVRLWDSGTRWATIQPRRGEFDWSVLDRLVDGAVRAGLPPLFVLGGTPAWAAPNGPEMAYDDGSRTAPPDDLADWDTFVRALVDRYRGRIDAYELWVMGNHPRYYTGTTETLVEMTRRASQIIKAADPKARVVCPGMGRLWEAEAQRVLQRFAELGGMRHCDVASVKLHQRTASDPPETMLDLLAAIDRAMHQSGVHPTLWNTGTTYDIPLQGSLDDVTATNYAVRFYLVGLYARQVSLERMYFYNWGGTKIPIVLQAEGGAPTRAALAVERLQRWLNRASIRACGHGRAVNLPDNVWQCEFTVAGLTDSDRPRDAVIRWTSRGTATTDAGPRAESITRLDGTTSAVAPGDTVEVTEQPILVHYRRAGE